MMAANTNNWSHYGEAKKADQLEIIPAAIQVIRHVKCKYACKSSEETIKIAKEPALPIPKSIATSGLLVHVTVSKYCNHLPLYQLLQYNIVHYDVAYADEARVQVLKEGNRAP